MPRQLSFHQDSWEEEEEETNLAMEDSWQMLLDNSEVKQTLTDNVCVCVCVCVWAGVHVALANYIFCFCFNEMFFL